MHIAILNLKDAVTTSVTGPADILGGLEPMYTRLTGKQLSVKMELDIITDDGNCLLRQAWGSTEQKPLKTSTIYDLVIVPAIMAHHLEAAVNGEVRVLEWIKEQHARKADAASICTGAFLLAATGLLDGKAVTTHWMYAQQFRQAYPKVVLQDDKIIVDQGRIYSCGGAFTFTTFMMYLVEKFCGHEVAVVASKMLMINMHQHPQSSFSIFRLQFEHSDPQVKAIQIFIGEHYRRPLTLTEMAVQSNMSNRNFMRRFEQATGNTPLEYLQRVRIEAAKQLLENTNDNIEQVAMQCGYEDLSFFRKIFKRHVSMRPSEYKLKYGKVKTTAVLAG